MNLILLFLTVIFLSDISFGQTTEDCPDPEGFVLDRQVCNNTKIRWKDSHILWLLPEVFRSTNVPAGISVSFSKADKVDLLNDLTPNSFTLREVLNKVITVQTQYFWKEDKGVVNVYPLEDYPILETTIKEFSVENATEGESFRKLLETEEFKQYIKSKNLREQDSPFIGGNFFQNKKNFFI